MLSEIVAFTFVLSGVCAVVPVYCQLRNPSPYTRALLSRSSSGFISRLGQYQRQQLTLYQWRLLIVAALCAIHYAISTLAWLGLLYVFTTPILRGPKARFWSDLFLSSLLYFRSFKATIPLTASLLAVYFIPTRPRYSLFLVLLVLAFSFACAWYDISHEIWDISYFGKSSGVIYCTWWWYDGVLHLWYDLLRLLRSSPA